MHHWGESASRKFPPPILVTVRAKSGKGRLSPRWVSLCACDACSGADQRNGVTSRETTSFFLIPSRHPLRSNLPSETDGESIAIKKEVAFAFAYFVHLASAIHCSDNSDCGFFKSCCSDNVCRRRCYGCSLNFQCGTGECCRKFGCSKNCSYCSFSFQCDIGECCKNHVCRKRCLDGGCRENCTYCSYSSQCDTGECCKDAKCKKKCSDGGCRGSCYFALTVLNVILESATEVAFARRNVRMVVVEKAAIIIAFPACSVT